MKHFFFDLDGTLAESKMPVSDAIRDALNKLPNVYVISGAQRQQMERQLHGVNCKILAQNGNDTDKWISYMGRAQKYRIYNHINKVRKKFKYKGDTEDRGCQISYSFTGHNAPLDVKKFFDPDKKIRNKILEDIPFVDEELIVVVAGSTCYDYLSKNGTKGANLKLYTHRHQKYKIINECVFFGDNLQEGGNDHSVVGVMETVPADTKNILKILEKYQEKN